MAHPKLTNLWHHFVQNHVSYNMTVASWTYTKVGISYGGLFSCMNLEQKQKLCLKIEMLISSTSLVLSRYYNKLYISLLPMKGNLFEGGPIFMYYSMQGYNM